MLQGSLSMMVNGQLYKASQAWNNKQWNREAREAAEREKREHDRSVEEWKAQVEGRGFTAHPAIPFGPPPKEPSSMRVLPDVHEALRQNDPSKAPGSGIFHPPTATPMTRQSTSSTCRGTSKAYASRDESGSSEVSIP